MNRSVERFKRKLKTNYNYSILVTLSMNLARMHSLHQIIDRIAHRNEIKTQKNYSIVVLRLALLMREKKLKIQDIFAYLKSQYKKCIRKKYQSNLLESEIIAIENNCEVNIDIFKRGLCSSTVDDKQASSIFIGLYDYSQKPKQRHIKWTSHLARIWIEVMQNKQCYQIVPKDLDCSSSQLKSQKIVDIVKSDSKSSEESELSDLVDQIEMIDSQVRGQPELKNFIFSEDEQNFQNSKKFENPELKPGQQFLN